MSECCLCAGELDERARHHTFVDREQVFCNLCWIQLSKAVMDDEADEIQKRKELFANLTGWEEIVVNRVYGGFSLSFKAVTHYLDLIGTNYSLTDREDRDMTNRYGQQVWVDGKPFEEDSIARNDPALVRTVLELGPDEASGTHAALEVVRIPAGIDWEIEDYDGAEWVAEVHRIW